MFLNSEVQKYYEKLKNKCFKLINLVSKSFIKI